MKHISKQSVEEKWQEFYKTYDTQQELMEHEIGCSFPIQGYILLLKAVKLPEKTKSGIILTNMQAETSIAYDIGKVIGIGPEAFTDPKRFPYGPYCKVGDWIDFRPFEKQKKFYNDHLCFIVSDDRINYPMPNIQTVIKELRSCTEEDMEKLNFRIKDKGEINE